MRTGDYPQGAVSLVGVIQVNPYREHPLEHRRRRLHVRYALLHGPSLEIRRLDPLADGDRQVLMPRHQPVRLGRLVEPDRPHRPRRAVSVATHEFKQLLRRRKSRHGGNRQHVSPARNVDGADGVQQFTPLRLTD